MKTKNEDPKYIVVIGTSAGGIRALEELVLQLDSEIDAAFFIVLHLSRKGVGDYFYQRLQQNSVLPVKVVNEDTVIQKGNIYLAPPDYHMLVDNGNVIIGKGAAENRWRPSINNLFRSAAANYNSSVIGIVLTGLLDDGTAGMSAIKKCGGITVVQDPDEADYPDMPVSVIENIEVDYIESLSRMGWLLKEITSTRNPEKVEIPYEILQESRLDKKVSTRVDEMVRFEKSDINCPDCGGGLFITQNEQPVHLRCHVGHSFTERELNIRLTEVLEGTFWTALRMMEERKALLLKMSRNDQKRGYQSSADQHLKRVEELEVHINNLKQMLFSVTNIN